jgi:hypothetical protein
MTAGKLIAYIAAGIFIFFGILFIWGAFSPQGQISWILIGILSVGIGFGLIWLAGRSTAPSASTQSVEVKIDLPGNVNLDTLKCQSCGGALSAEHIKMIAGAPVVSCPYCGTTYQLTEQPKW